MSRKQIVAALGLEAVVLGVLLVVTLDQYAHKQVQLMGGLNSWGYRGTVAKQRVFDETRLVIVGGTQAFGFGVAVKESTTSYLRYMIESWVTFDRGPVTAVNLGVLGLPRGAYAARLERHRYLAPDVICVYVDLAPNPTAAAHRSTPSGVARLTGYMPSLPVVLPEKGDLLAQQGNPLGSVLRLTGRAFGAADTGLARVAGSTEPTDDAVTAVVAAVDVALGIAPGAVVVIPEPHTEAAVLEREQLVKSLERFAGDPRVRVVRLGQRFPGYREHMLPDGVNLGSAGQHNAALEIEPVVSEMLRARRAVKPS
jgi:hypothetical protein